MLLGIGYNKTSIFLENKYFISNSHTLGKFKRICNGCFKLLRPQLTLSQIIHFVGENEIQIKCLMVNKQTFLIARVA